MNQKILLVDDDPNVLSGFQRNLRQRFSVDVASSGLEALEKIGADRHYAVVVADMKMPGISGLDLLVRIKAIAPDTVRMMLTGDGDLKTAIDAVNQGHVFRFLSKPCSTEALIPALEAGLRQYELAMAERELLERTLNGTIRLLTELLAGLCPEAFGRGEKVRTYVREFADFGMLPYSWDIEAAALLAPVGYLTLPAALVSKLRTGQQLSAPEASLVERLPEIGAELLHHIPRLESVAAIVRYQHQGYDGSGVPQDGLVGSDIPNGARVLRLLTDLVSLELALGSRDSALAALKERSGIYDPGLLAIALKCFERKAGDAVSENGMPFAGPVTEVRRVMLHELRIGQVLASPVETQGGILLAKAGTRLTLVGLHRLQNFAELNPIREPIEVLGEPEILPVNGACVA